MKAKTCTSCKATKPLSDFCKFKLAKDGLTYICKLCNRERARSYYQKNREEIIRKRGVYRKSNPDTLMPWRGWRSWDKKRGYGGTLSKEDFILITSKPCHYCGASSPSGLDRIDNKKGHTALNCLPCCDWCNTARSDHFTVLEMEIIGRAIAQIRQGRKMYVAAIQ